MDVSESGYEWPSSASGIKFEYEAVVMAVRNWVDRLVPSLGAMPYPFDDVKCGLL